MPPASMTPRKLLKKSAQVGSMIATVSPGRRPEATRPAATRPALSYSCAWEMSWPVSPSSRWMWTRAGSISVWRRRTSAKVAASRGGAAASRDGCAIGQRESARVSGPTARIAPTQSPGVSAAWAAASGSRTAKADSRRTSSSTRSRLPRPRSRSRDERRPTRSAAGAVPNSRNSARTVSRTVASTVARRSGTEAGIGASP